MKYLVEPWKHQLDAIDRASPRKDGYALFMEMGAGKTLTAVNIMRHKCYEKKRLLRTLVLCPPVVRENWRREFKASSNVKNDKLHILQGAGKKRLEYFTSHAFDKEDYATGGVFITNYESLQMNDLFKALMTWRPEVIIYDESHKLKSIKAKRTKLAIKLSDLAEYNLLLTGTPILNTPLDVWSQFRILDGGNTFGRGYHSFKQKYFVDKNESFKHSQKYFPNWQPRKELAEIFNTKIYKKASRVLKKDCLDLPPFVRKRVEVEMTAEQKKMYKSMEKDFIAYIDGKACVASIALTKALRMQQIVTGYFIDDEGKSHRFKKNPRIDALKELLEGIGQGHKIIIWAMFRENIHQVIDLLEEMKINYRTLYGGMTDTNRQEAIDSFQDDPSVQVIVSNQAAGGTGVNLTAASYAIYYSRSFNLEHDLQSEARNYRGGSNIHQSVTRVDIVSPDTIDDAVLDALARKENLANNILKLKKTFYGR